MTTAALVPAAGRGQRFGSPENKIWAKIAGRPVVWWAVSALNKHDSVDSIVVIAGAEEVGRVTDALAGLSKLTTVVTGGITRAESVLHGLRAAESDYVLVHDAARPLVSQDVITRVLEETRRTGAAVPGVPVGDTLKRADASGVIQDTVPRENLWAVQTPQGARRDTLVSAYDRLRGDALAMTDESGILEAAGQPVSIVVGDSQNLKITRPEDLQTADRILRSRDPRPETRDPVIRTGFGYDIHAFAQGRPLWLGGVRIPHTRGLAGHSDADVLLHAVCDALLGAAGLGDIGRLFPDTDPAHKDRASIEFLHEVRDRIESSGWRVVNVDVTLLAEEPKIGPYRDQISAVIADGLRTAPTQINIKATTSEGLGFAGRREGIACWAVATLTPNPNS